MAKRTTAAKSAAPSPTRGPRKPSAATRGRKPADAHPRLLSGGNPQIAKAYGEAPVRAYIAAMPGWKRAIGRRLDAIITLAVPDVRKAVKWNSPLYGTADEAAGWFMSMHCFDKYIKVAFFRGASLHPLPPGSSKQKHVRYLDIGKSFLQPDGILSKEIMPDLLHLSAKGYQIWADAIKGKVAELMK